MGNDRSITIVSEPEAAAAYAIKMMEPLSLEVGNNVVICDAGGGTVDLITYRILSLSPLEVEESAIPNVRDIARIWPMTSSYNRQGGKCGGVFVNRIFEKLVNNRLGSDSGLTDLGRHQVR